MIKSEETFYLFFESRGFKVSTFSKDEKRIKNKKTPDFKVLLDDILLFYCEVKEIQEDNRDYENGSLNDNTYDIISECINDSYKQFISVNEEHLVPNILAIYSNRHGTDILDYKYTCEGGFYSKERFYPILKKVSEGRIKEKKQLIDLCICYDKITETFNYMVYNDSKYRDMIYKYFSSK